MSRVLRRILALSVMIPATQHAQAAPKSDVWLIVCNGLKQGMTAEMMANETRWARANEKAGIPGIAMVNMTGPAQACWITPTGTFENMEKMMGAAGSIGGQYEAATRSYANDTRMYTVRTRPDLVMPGPTPATDYRGVSWGVFRIRPGQDALFERAVKAYVAAQKRAGLPADNAVCLQVMNGAAGVEYWFMAGMKSLKDLDAEMAADPKVLAAMTPDDLKLFQEFFEKAVISSTSNLYMFNPVISSLPADQRKAAGDFWKLPAAGAAKKP